MSGFTYESEVYTLLFTLLGNKKRGELLMPQIEEYGKVKRLSYSRIEQPIDLPNLIQVQLSSYGWFL